jgi:hypothetical protein
VGVVGVGQQRRAMVVQAGARVAAGRLSA